MDKYLRDHYTKKMEQHLYDTQEYVGKKIKTFETFDLYYSGWECDEVGFFVTLDDGSKLIMRTDHGGFYVATQEEMVRYIYSLKNAVAETENILIQAGMLEKVI